MRLFVSIRFFYLVVNEALLKTFNELYHFFMIGCFRYCFPISSFLYFLSNFESRMIHPGLRSERYIGSRTQNLSFDQTKTQVTWLESYNRQELHILHGHMGSLSVLDGASVAYHFHFLCCVVVFCVNLLSFSCVLCAQRCQCFWIVLF